MQAACPAPRLVWAYSLGSNEEVKCERTTHLYGEEFRLEQSQTTFTGRNLAFLRRRKSFQKLDQGHGKAQLWRG
jgi:hypothetical protein